MENIEREKVIYEQSCEVRRLQQGAIDLLNNKHQWLIAGSIAIIVGTVFSKGYSNIRIFAILFCVLVIINSLFSIRTKTYKIGPSLEELDTKMAKNNWSAQKTLEKINKKIIKDLRDNRPKISELKRSIWLSIIPLFLGIITLVYSLFYIHIFL